MPRLRTNTAGAHGERRRPGRPRIYDPDQDWQEVREYMEGRAEVPSRDQFDADGKGALYERLRRHERVGRYGTVGRALAAEFGLALPYPRPRAKATRQEGAE
jgi:hypothetical protein